VEDFNYTNENIFPESIELLKEINQIYVLRASSYILSPNFTKEVDEEFIFRAHQEFLKKRIDFQNKINCLYEREFIQRELRKNPDLPQEEEYFYFITQKGKDYLQNS
jgi:hypothetical protein